MVIAIIARRFRHLRTVSRSSARTAVAKGDDGCRIATCRPPAFLADADALLGSLYPLVYPRTPRFGCDLLPCFLGGIAE